KYMTESTSSSDSEFQVKKYLTAEKQKAFLIFMIKFIQFSSSQSHVSMKIQSTVHYVIFFLTFRTSEALYFTKSDVIKFVEHFENFRKNHEMSEQQIIEVISHYCKQKIQDIIKAQNI